MFGFDKFLENPSGKPIAIGLALIAIGIAAYSIKASFVPGTVRDESERWYIDATTMQGFRHEIKLGETVPVEAPSGNKTGYPAELCYWTKDGTVKSTPTFVLMNFYIGKSGPTFCPDCGRLVVPDNPVPTPGMRPPPTREEWEKEHMVGVGPELLYSVTRRE